MRQYLLYFLYLLLLVSVFTGFPEGCASPGSIQGGSKDETPPMVDSIRSTPTPQTNFRPQEIVITFDEWVKLDDPFSQIFISPPLEKRPQYRLKGKSLIITFDEEEKFQDNTTYIVNLGTSVQDITESNPVEDFQFVFSTGPRLDSLGFDGVVTDALTGEPIENVSIMLYKNLADSAISTLQPAYFARTNKNGHYRFNYLQADTFQLLGYLDDDLDFRYNSETEPLGFIPHPISTAAVNNSTLSFSLSLGPPPVYLDKVDSATAGLLVLTFSGPVEDTASLLMDTVHIRYYDRIQNQIRAYYHPDKVPVRIISENIKGLRDTVELLVADKPVFDALNLEIARTDPTLLPRESLTFKTNWPVHSVNSVGTELTKQNDSTTIPIDTFTHGFNTLDLKFPWVADTMYQVIMYPGAIQFENDIQNDTLKFRIQPVNPDDLASLVLTFVADSGYLLPPQFILKLKQKDKVVEQKIIKKVDQEITFSALKPGAYTLEVIWDENKNGIWDPARYPGRRPAEHIQKVEIENLRINWIQETEVRLSQGDSG